MLRKRKISYRYSAHRIRRAETAAREDPVREMDRTHREHPVRIVRQAEETDSVRLPVRMDPVRIVRREGRRQMERERTEDHRKDARQETDVRKRDREAVSVSVRLLLQTVREETVARTRGQEMVSVRIPEETTEMTETTEIQFRRHW